MAGLRPLAVLHHPASGNGSLALRWCRCFFEAFSWLGCVVCQTVQHNPPTWQAPWQKELIPAVCGRHVPVHRTTTLAARHMISWAGVDLLRNWVTVYLQHLQARLEGHAIARVLLGHPPDTINGRCHGCRCIGPPQTPCSAHLQAGPVGGRPLASRASLSSSQPVMSKWGEVPGRQVCTIYSTHSAWGYTTPDPAAQISNTK